MLNSIKRLWLSAFLLLVSMHSRSLFAAVSRNSHCFEDVSFFQCGLDAIEKHKLHIEFVWISNKISKLWLISISLIHASTYRWDWWRWVISQFGLTWNVTVFFCCLRIYLDRMPTNCVWDIVSVFFLLLADFGIANL